MRSMSFDGRCVRAAAALALVMSVYSLLAPSTSTLASSEVTDSSETRALWVQRGSLATRESIGALVKAARDHGFNTLLVQVRGRGDAYYLGGVEPRAPELLRQPDGFDPLATVLESGHAAGLRIHAWVNINLVSSAAELPSAREHVIHRHPAWLMVPRDIGQQLGAVEPDSPAYVGTLARWTRTQSSEIEGLYLSPIAPESADYTDGIVRHLAHSYALDGIHLDYARYPNDRFDYSRTAIREFRAAVRPQLADSVRRALDAQEQDDLFAYPDSLAEQWRTFRVSRMTALIAPQANFVDTICPMAYTTDADKFAEQIAQVRATAGSRLVWAGIGSYRLSAKETIDNIVTARRLGASGIVLFSYDNLTARDSASDYLSVVGRAVFTSSAPAASGSR
ncbi:MAG: family 10 glycosylhydrolase [Acidobacteria bacterium]|nr:family 10 glycosylhydrolase [Acidobacteriota bacterium]